MLQGRIVYATTRFAGASTVGIEAAGQTAISLDNIRDFPMDAGFVSINEVVLPYTAVNRTTNVLTIATGLTATLPAGTLIMQYPYSVQRWALVDYANGQGDPTDAVWCLVPHALAGFIRADGLRDIADQERVWFQETENHNFMISDIIDRQPYLDPFVIPEGSIQETMITPGAITTPLLAANSVATQHLQAGAVTGDTIDADAINGMVITGALFRSASTGKRVELSTTGLTQFDASGAVVLTIGDVNKFTGDIDATSITIRDSLNLFGRNNVFAVGSKVTLKSNVTAPSQAPALTWVYESGPSQATISPNTYYPNAVHTDAGGTNPSMCLVFLNSVEMWKGTTKWVFPQLDYGDPSGTTQSEFKPGSMVRVSRAIDNAERVVQIGPDYNHMVLGYPENWIRTYDDSTMNSSGTVAPVLKNQFRHSDGKPITRQLRLIRMINGGSWKNQFGLLEMNDVKGTSLRSLTLNIYQVNNDDTVSWITSADFGNAFSNAESISGGVYANSLSIGLDGASRTVLVVQTNLNNYVYNATAGAWEPGSYFPTTYGTQDRTWWGGSVPNNTVTESYSYNYAWGAGQVQTYKYAANHKSTAQNPIWGAFTWRGDASTSYQTPSSPRVVTTFRNMATLRVSMPALPTPSAGVGGTRDPAKDVYGWTYYLGSGATDPLNSGMYLQATQPTMVAGTALVATSIDLRTFPLFSGTNPPTVTTFPGASPATIESENGLLVLAGDGKITADELLGGAIDKLLDLIIPVGTILELASAVAPYRTVLCDGTIVSRIGTYANLFARIGTAFNTGGETATQFRLPNRQNRVGIGAVSGKVLGSQGGQELVTLTWQQSGTQGVPSHTHNVYVGYAEGLAAANWTLGDSAAGQRALTVDATATTSNTTAIPASNAAQSHSVMQPYTVFNYYIRY